MRPDHALATLITVALLHATSPLGAEEPHLPVATQPAPQQAAPTSPPLRFWGAIRADTNGPVRAIIDAEGDPQPWTGAVGEVIEGTRFRLAFIDPAGSFVMLHDLSAPSRPPLRLLLSESKATETMPELERPRQEVAPPVQDVVRPEYTPQRERSAEVAAPVSSGFSRRHEAMSAPVATPEASENSQGTSHLLPFVRFDGQGRIHKVPKPGGTQHWRSGTVTR